MLRLLLATTNKGKLREMREALSGLDLELLSPADWGPAPAPAETGRTFAENARLKALHYHRLTGWTSLADDSGLQVEALDGAPGLHSARYAPTDAQRIQRLLRELNQLEGGDRPENRRAKFVCAVCLAGDGLLIEVEGEVHGWIAPQPRGESGFGYDPVFFHPESGKTFGEIPGAEKNRVSHRAVALAKLRERLSEVGPSSRR